jgi:hypothetical protein
MTILYPIAASADEALRAPKGFAVREREAREAAAGPVEFVSEGVGPAFATREALAEAFKTAVGQPWSDIRPVAKGDRAKGPIKPVNADGRRWPQAKAAEPVLWRLSISYWRMAGSEAPPADAARKLRRDPEAGNLDPKALRALARQPLRAMKPQQPLDVGLFEVRLPESPHLLMPDE